MIPAGLKKAFAFGSGVGIQIVGSQGAESLRVAAARVRPNGARLVDTLLIDDFQRQPAGVWGANYGAFLRKLGMRQAVAVVLLPRTAVTLRPISLPGVSDGDLANAVRFQMDGLHPYSEDDIYAGWTRLPGTSIVLVAVARRQVIDRYEALFEEAGIRVSGFTCSAAAVYSALRVFGATPPAEILAVDDSTGALEFYGESPARPLFSASFHASNDRASTLAAAELRIAPGAEPVALSKLLGSDHPLPFAAALSSACPLLSLPLNLLPADRRQASSRLRWVPTVALGTAALAIAGLFIAFPAYENHKYIRSLEAQIAAVKPAADRAVAIDKQVTAMRARIQLLDDWRRHPKADMDVIAELTRILPPPTWVNLMQISPKQVIVGGETPEAAPLLSVLDNSRLFEGSEFQAAPIRVTGGEQFRIRTNREGVK